MARNPELEAAILAERDEDAGYLVYADWLLAEGDPRGELAMLQAERARHDSPALAAREQLLHEAHDHVWLGALEAGSQRPDGHRLSWRAGWLDQVLLRARVGGLGHAYAHLAQLESARFLRGLVIGAPADATLDGPRDVYADLRQAVARHGVPFPLRSLVFAAFSQELSSIHLGDCSGFLRELPHLRQLHLRGAWFRLGRIDLPALREARLDSGGFTGENLRDLARGHFPELTSLELLLGNPRVGGNGRCEDLWPLLARDDLAGLRQLALTNVAFADELAGVLPDSPLLTGLERLDLSFGNLSDGGGQLLLDRADAFRHLASLDLSLNYLGSGMLAQLREALPQIISSEQLSVDPDNPTARQLVVRGIW